MQRESIALFWAKVERAGDCWVWTGSTNGNGYGRLRRNGVSAAAHRVSWELLYGPIPMGLFLLHSCDNKPCVRPAHLSLGTRTDNTREARERGRLSLHRVTRLTEDQVRAIRESHGVSIASLAREHGVAWLTVRNVIQYKSWRHVA